MLALAFTVLLALVLLTVPGAAQQSGCHAAHSCPSDADPPSYICGDTGHCSQCLDNQYCLLGQPRGTLSLDLTLNRTTVAPGQLVEASATVTNTVGDMLVDVYLLIVPPSAAGPGLGCPGGDALLFLVDGAYIATCASAPPETFPATAPGVLLSALPPTAVPNFWSVAWASGNPPGTYTFVIVLTPAGAFADGVVDAGDFLAIGADSLSASP